jgi:sugar O-acyltransferase (sialic acid O-acetyltransferase NeuD family)
MDANETIDVILYGAKGGAKMVLDTIRGCKQFNVVGLVDSILPLDSIFFGIKVIGSEKDLNKICSNRCNNVIISFSNKDNLKFRENVITKLTDMGFNFPNIISSSSFIEPSASIGKGNFIASNVYIGSDTKIGSWNFFNPGSTICHDVSIGNNNHFSSGTTISGYVQILNNCCFGLNTGVVNGVIIGNDFILKDFENLKCSFKK